MKKYMIFLMLIASAAITQQAAATTIAGWNFEDQDLIVDLTTPNNTTNTVATSSTATADYFQGPGGVGLAASFTNLAEQNVSYVEFPVNTTGFSSIRFLYSGRTSNTSSKYWKVQYSSTGSVGTFTDFGDIIAQNGTVWTINNYLDMSAIADLNNNANVVIRIVATDSLGDGTGEWVQADGSGTPANAGGFRFDDVSITDEPFTTPTPAPATETPTPGLTNTPTETPTGPTPTSPPVTAIKINEVYINPPGTDVGCYVELYFPGGATLDGYTLVGVNGGGGADYQSIDLTGYAIPVDGFFVIAQDDTVLNADLISTNVNYQNGPDSIQLRAGATLVDAIGYGDFSGGEVFAGEGLPAPAFFTGTHSHSRIPDGTDSDDNSVDFVSGNLTPGDINIIGSDETPTPTYTPTPPPVLPIKINEVHVNPDGTDMGCFIELYNSAAEPALLDGYHLVGVNGSDGADYSDIALSGTIAPFDYFVIAQDDTVPNADLIDTQANHQNGPDSIQLRAGAEVVDAIGYGDFSGGETFAGEGLPIAYPVTTNNKSLSRLPDGADTEDNSVDFADGELTAGLANVAEGQPTNTPGPETPTPTATSDTPTPGSTNTPEETSTPGSPTNTPGGPTDTPLPATDTPLPATETPMPSETPTYTPIPPTSTPVPPTNTPPPTSTPTQPPTAPPTTLPTSTPVPSSTPQPTATPTQSDCTTTNVAIEMPLTTFHPGDDCWCKAHICNQEGAPLENHPVFVILAVYGAYFFAPSFSSELDTYLATLPEIPTGLTSLDVLPTFEWPSEVGSASGIVWYGAITNPEMTQLVGEFGMFEFGWAE